MGTNAIIALTRRGETVAKIVVGCEGANAGPVARVIMKVKSIQVADLYRIASRGGLGCPDCLVVMDRENVRPSTLDPLIAAIYRRHFPNPAANPHTNGGSVYQCIRIDVEKWREEK